MAGSDLGVTDEHRHGIGFVCPDRVLKTKGQLASFVQFSFLRDLVRPVRLGVPWEASEAHELNCEIAALRKMVCTFLPDSLLGSMITLRRKNSWRGYALSD
jgi:hypothetical protein